MPTHPPNLPFPRSGKAIDGHISTASVTYDLPINPDKHHDTGIDPKSTEGQRTHQSAHNSSLPRYLVASLPSCCNPKPCAHNKEGLCARACMPLPYTQGHLRCMRVCIQQISTGIEVTGKARGNCGSFPSCNNPVAAKQVLLGGQEYAGNFKPLLIAAGLA